MKSLGEILLEMGAIDPLQLKVAESHALQWGMGLDRAVVERRFCSADDVVRAFSLQTGYPVINLDAEVLDPAQADLLPLKVAEQFRVVPLRLAGRRYEVIELALAAPPNLQAVDAVRAFTKKQRVVVHITHDEALSRAIARMYGKGGVAPPPAVAAPVRERKVAVQNEQLFEFGEEPPPPAQPVYLFGWHPAAGKAMAMMLQQGHIASEPLADEALPGIGPYDVVLSTTLGLRAVMPADARLKCLLIICGTQEAGDPEDARSLGARLYLRPPHSTEQLVKAVQHVLRPK